MIGRAALGSAVARLTGNRREVLMTYPGLRLGNFMYFYLQAHLREVRGEQFRVLRHGPEVPAHHGLVPAAERYEIGPASLRFSDRRRFLPDLFFQRFGLDFTTDELNSFIKSQVLASEAASERPNRTAPPASVAVNVRRGDYYSNAEYIRMLGIDIPAFVQLALTEVMGALAADRLGSVTIVSDDVEWCRRHLAWIDDAASDLRFVGPDDGVLESFFTVAEAEHVILSNSTFSYWAGYVGDVMHGPAHRVWAPDLHTRNVDGGRPWQHAPHWRRVAVSAPTAD